MRAADGWNATAAPPGSNGGPVAYPNANGHATATGTLP